MNISTNLVKGYKQTDRGVQSYNPTIASFFLQVEGEPLTAHYWLTPHHALYDLSPIKWFQITDPNNVLKLNVNFWPKYTVPKQLRWVEDISDANDFVLNFQIDLHLVKLQ